MARARKTDRKNCQQADSSIFLPSTAPRESNTIVDTPRRVRLLCDAHTTAGKLPRQKLFEAHGIPKSTGYQILKSESARRGDGVHNRGRKRVLALYECEAIETVEDASFYNGTSSHYAVASVIGVANGSERAIQRNMTDFGVGTYRAQQKKFIKFKNVEARGI
jgi:hypothetical protein